jgi:hypothetical protein
MDPFFEALNEVSANSPLFSSIAEQPKENKVRKREDVKRACYRQQPLKCQNDNGTSVFFFVWTLFVQWQDDTIDCWFRAKDVANGLGYKQADAASRIAKFLSDDNRIIEWGFIEQFLWRAPDSEQKLRTPEYLQAKQLNIRSQFLTTLGLRDVFLHCPKCKLRKKKPGRESMIYVITSKYLQPQNVYKIGYTTASLEERLISLNITSHTEEHVLFAYFTFNTNHPRELEKYLHEYYHSQRLRGEFFSLTEAQINKLKQLCENFSNAYA